MHRNHHHQVVMRFFSPTTFELWAYKVGLLFVDSMVRSNLISTLSLNLFGISVFDLAAKKTPVLLFDLSGRRSLRVKPTQAHSIKGSPHFIFLTFNPHAPFGHNYLDGLIKDALYARPSIPR